MHPQIPPELKPTLVNLFVLSHVRRCFSVFGNASEGDMQCLEKILNFMMRTLSGRRELDHTSGVRKKLGWSAARQLYELHSLNPLHDYCRT